MELKNNGWIEEWTDDTSVPKASVLVLTSLCKKAQQPNFHNSATSTKAVAISRVSSFYTLHSHFCSTQISDQQQFIIAIVFKSGGTVYQWWWYDAHVDPDHHHNHLHNSCCGVLESSGGKQCSEEEWCYQTRSATEIWLSWWLPLPDGGWWGPQWTLLLSAPESHCA